MSRLRSGCIAFVLVLALGARAEAQRGDGPLFLLPFDLTQGAMTNAAGVTPYVASAKLQTALGFGAGGPVRIGPLVAVRYANPDWTIGLGGRIQWLPVRFGLGGRRWGFGVLAEKVWDTGGYGPSLLGLVADLELARLSGGLVHEWESERTGFELGIGTDLRSLKAVFFPSEDEDPFGGIP